LSRKTKTTYFIYTRTLKTGQRLDKDWTKTGQRLDKDWTKTEPKERNQQRLVTSEIQSTWRFKTRGFEEIHVYREMFYPTGKKTLTPETIDFLLSSPVVLAYWHMDDGSKKGDSGYNLYTCGFSLDENNELSKALQHKFGLEARVRVEGGNRLYIPAASKQKFRELIEPYIVPSMRYKL
jgi:hypothetical protein